MPKLTKPFVIKNSDDREKKMNNKTSHPPYQLKHLGEIVWPYDSLFYDCNIKSVLDIGANMGEYSSFLKSRHNDCKFFCIEANPYCEPYLKKTGLDYKIITLSNNQKEVSLFLDNIDDVSTGTSYYREINDETFGNNRHMKVKTNTLDNVINDKFGCYPLFDFIKMDTQGSELDILQGGRETIKKCRFLLVEVSIKPYNRLAPLAKEVDDYIVNLGFIKRSTADVLILEDVIHQEDWLYENLSNKNFDDHEKKKMNISYGGPVENLRQRVLNQVGQWKQENPNFRVIDVGGNATGWSSSIADMVVDINSKNTDKSISFDICRLNEWSKLIDDVNINGKYDYAICTHTLEDVYNPFSALECLPRIANAGIISMPSITTELSRLENADWLGYVHHRWIFDQQDGVMVVVPKISFLEKLLGNGVNRNIDRDEIVYDWKGSIDYKIFMDNYLGPNVATVIKEYKQFIIERIGDDYVDNTKKF